MLVPTEPTGPIEPVGPTDPHRHRHRYQVRFHERWSHLNNPHVRTLAWLLDAPDLLDPRAEEWQGRVASLEPVDEMTRAWLDELDSLPAALQASLEVHPHKRLGRYAEQLMAFYLQHRRWLVAHGVQVRAGKNQTIGEFDFLLRQGDALVHWEFATKLYLLESGGHGRQADYYVGPNLADTLGAKIRKIMDQQLMLSQHPAALAHLPQPVNLAQALIKGWLFYHGETPLPAQPQGISHGHCKGFWCALQEVRQLSARHYAVLPRLGWLAPAKLPRPAALSHEELTRQLQRHFQENDAPVLIALLEEGGQDFLLESDRGFIVPDDWRSRAEVRIRHAG
ncbi:DUF1853 family protein [Noviherbaspirillum aerium]|uniref:DUF1853 family protein n=1 Tax=Noviherbaspirillum aerium TaxID=2588497 RepID=UPI00124D6AB9|nr:DUF1853 family protein [Noviherbaspirillum aerium]